jgi:hypothetical protein
MAYDASNTKDNQQQIAGANPLSQGGGQSTPMAQGDQQGQTGPSTPATIQAGQSSTQAAQSQQPQQSNKPASSGMFTNIKSYVEKNQPAAQKMAGAVSQNVGDQASQIKEAADKKAADQKAAIDANNQAMDQQRQEAAGIIHSQTGVAVGGFQPPQTPATEQQPEVPQNEQQAQPEVPDQSNRFQELMQGPTGLTQVGDVNLAQQQAKAQALQQMAQGANTEQGRMNLLKNTFGNQGETQYTRGLSGLDQLVVSGDQTAREQMIKGTQEQTNQLQQQIQEVGSEANRNKMAQDYAMQNFGADISNLSQESQNQILAEIDANIESQKADWLSQIDALREQAAAEFQSGLKFNSAEDFYRSLLNQDIEWSKAGDRDTLDNALIRANLLGEDVNLADVYKSRKLSGSYEGLTPEQLQAMQGQIVLGTDSQGRIGGALGDLLQNASDYGLDPNTYMKELQALAQGGNRNQIYGYSGHQNKSGTNVHSYDAAKFKEITDRLFGDISAAKDNSFQRLVENKFGDQYKQALGEGQTFDDFLAGNFLDRTGAATADQASKIEALQRLTGAQTNVLGTERGTGVGQDTALFQALRDRLAAGQS